MGVLSPGKVVILPKIPVCSERRCSVLKELQVKTFGNLVISTGDAEVTSEGNRSRKAWVLLGYLIYNRHRAVKKSELIELLWGSGDDSINSAGALKTLIYRLRSELDALWAGAGWDLVLSEGDGYRFNTAYPVCVDCEMFGQDSEDLEETLEKLRLYRGSFLPNMGSELWVITLAARYHNIYVDRLQALGPRLIEAGRSDELLAF